MIKVNNLGRDKWRPTIKALNKAIKERKAIWGSGRNPDLYKLINYRWLYARGARTETLYNLIWRIL